MSKFIDKLANLNRAIIPPLGFGRSNNEEKPEPMLLMVELAGKSADEVRNLMAAGVAAGLVDISGLTAGALAKLSSAGLPVGLLLSNGKPAGLKVANGGIDFIVYGPELPLRAFEGWPMEQTGKVLSLDLAADAGLMRSVNNLYPGVDAVLVDLTVSPLMVGHMMSCRRAADFSGQPVIARTGNSLSIVELTALREAGVKCLLLSAATHAEEVKALSETIKALPKPARKKGPKDVPLVPIIGLVPEKEEEDGGDDDGDGDDGD